ncbi:MAG: RimK family alpha-L-glutamate ligase [Sulfolobales archaeon]|nr:RimK family alpha-L-glutamate ligase [Sulfolobales archaeon]MDW7969960.1 RimK family alpha-L-glutamate ligase [Sulfolobales archaeon]
MNYYLAVDIIRSEEKLIIEAFKDIGVDVMIVKVDGELLPLVDGTTLNGSLVVVRPISAFNAIYSAVAFESLGAFTVNSSRTLYLCNDKILTYGCLVREGLRIPKTYIALSSTSLQSLGNRLNFPLIDKPPIGSWGRLVSYIRDSVDLKMISEHRDYMGPIIKTHVVQEVIGLGKDLRCLVIGDEVLGCMMRVASGDEWRSNVALGGRVENYPVNSEVEELAIKASKAVGAEFAGVDLLIGDGYYVNEVNGVPEFKGFMKATGVKVHERLVKYLVGSIKR